MNLSPRIQSPFFSRECSTALKGIAIMLVIFGHRGLIDGAGSWGVLIFLVLSGYGISKSVLKKGLDGYWQNRVIGVLMPYALFSFIQLGLSLFMGEKFGVGGALCTLMGLDFGLNVDPTMWYTRLSSCATLCSTGLGVFTNGTGQPHSRQRCLQLSSWSPQSV